MSCKSGCSGEPYKILLSRSEIYDRVKQEADAFHAFIEKTWGELDKYSKEELETVGVTPSNVSNPLTVGTGTYELIYSNSVFHLACFNEGVRASYWTNKDTALGKEEESRNRRLAFVSNKFSFWDNGEERYFLLSNEESCRELYVEAIESSNGKVGIDNNQRCYTLSANRPDEVSDYNKRDTFYAAAPFIRTTYDSLEMANEDFLPKISEFKDAWNKILGELETRYGKRTKSYAKIHRPLNSSSKI